MGIKMNCLNSSTIESKNKQRNSNIELFRILATFLVLLVHMNGYFVGLDLKVFNFHSFPQIVVEALSCIAVNCFILITGFFGVKLSFHTIWKLWQSLICIYVPLFIFECIFDPPVDGLYIKDILHAISPFSSRDGYFINGYIFLIIVSPFMNTYINTHSRKHILIFSIGMAVFEFWVDCICNLQTFFFNGGYSGLHFCVVYMIGQSIKLYYKELKSLHPRLYLFIYIIISAIIVLLSILKVPFTYNYSNILLIISACSLFLLFAVRTPFYNKYINRLAQCSLYVYILQISSPFMGWLCEADVYVLNNFNWISYMLIVCGICIIFYIFCFIWDYTRQLFTKRLFDSIEYKINRFAINIKNG